MKRKLGFEQLEDRNLCALDLKLSSSGTLKITGDNGPDEFRLAAFNGGAGIQTPFGITTILNVKNIQIDLKGGDDRVRVDVLQIPGTLKINTGTGNDSVFIEPQDRNVFVGGATTINLGKEDFDYLEMKAVFHHLTFNSATTVTSSDINITSLNFSDRDIVFNSGLTIKEPSGSLHNRIDLDGSGGNSAYQAGDIFVNGNLSISSGASTWLHFDDVNVRPTSLGKGGKTTIKLSGFNDQLFVDDSNFYGDVSASFGNGDELIRIQDSRYNAKLTVDGGGGSNLAFDTGTFYAVTPKIKKLTNTLVTFSSSFPF